MKLRESGLLLLLFLGIIALDFFSKAYVSANVPLMNWGSTQFPYGGIAVFHNFFGIDFSINHVINKGAAWGMFASMQKVLLYFRICVIGGIIVYLFKARDVKAKRMPLVLIVSGAIGNVVDYFLYGHVIDMFHLRFWGYTYPIFNIADSAIFCGIAWLFLLSFRSKRRPVSV